MNKPHSIEFKKIKDDLFLDLYREKELNNEDIKLLNNILLKKINYLFSKREDSLVFELFEELEVIIRKHEEIFEDVFKKDLLILLIDGMNNCMSKKKAFYNKMYPNGASVCDFVLKEELLCKHFLQIKDFYFSCKFEKEDKSIKMKFKILELKVLFEMDITGTLNNSLFISREIYVNRYSLIKIGSQTYDHLFRSILLFSMNIKIGEKINYVFSRISELFSLKMLNKKQIKDILKENGTKLVTYARKLYTENILNGNKTIDNFIEFVKNNDNKHIDISTIKMINFYCLLNKIDNDSSLQSFYNNFITSCEKVKLEMKKESLLPLKELMKIYNSVKFDDIIADSFIVDEMKEEEKLFLKKKILKNFVLKTIGSFNNGRLSYCVKLHSFSMKKFKDILRCFDEKNKKFKESEFLLITTKLIEELFEKIKKYEDDVFLKNDDEPYPLDKEEIIFYLKEISEFCKSLSYLEMKRKIDKKIFELSIKPLEELDKVVDNKFEIIFPDNKKIEVMKFLLE